MRMENQKPEERKGEYRRIQYAGVIYYGKHLIVTAKGCNKNILDISAITKFLATLTKRIDMVAYGDPVVARFGQGIEIGISAVQLIETSAITIHTNDSARDMYLDVFSCKTFDEEKAIAFIKKTFSPKSMNQQVLLR